MSNFYKRKAESVEAYKLTVENMAGLETWSRGAIKGTMLSPEYRAIDVSNIWDEESRAYVGDWIVKEIDGFYAMFEARFWNTYE